MFTYDSVNREYPKEIRVYLIKNIAEIIIEKNLTSREAILSFLDHDGRYSNDCVEILNELSVEEIDENELNQLDKLISNQLRYCNIEDKSDELMTMLTNLKTENYDSLEDQVKGISEFVDKFNRDLKSSRESLEDAKKDLNLSSSGFLNVLGNIIQKERNPSSRVKTGLQCMNLMLNGGFEKQRVYCALGVAKGWKSGFLLNTMSWAKRYNTFLTNDPSLKPVIVYLSMENSNEETITRLWNHCFGNDSNMKDFEAVDAARMFEKEGLFTPNDPNAPELMIWYRSNRSINTADLNAMLEDLKKEGKECVFLILDYLKRIRPVETSKELRIELSNITNELKTIATEQNIPILTAQQLNREAFKALEDAGSFEEKLRASDKLGASNVGESIDIIQNVDFAFIVNRMQKRVVNDDGDIQYSDRYLFLKLIACRTKQPSITTIHHRFMDGNDMRLIEDINFQYPVSVISETELIRDRQNQNGQKTNGRRVIAGGKK